MDRTSAQIYDELRNAVRDSLQSRRPLLHHLNDDSSWLIQIPRPENAVKRRSRSYFNILIDPWLKGGQSDVASRFSQQFHATESAVQTITELEDSLRELEILAFDRGAGRKATVDIGEELDRSESLIDAVAISHEFTDHAHKETLLELQPNVPVFAAQEAAKLISSWKHFRTVITLGVFGAHGNGDWRSTSIPPLPEWCSHDHLEQQTHQRAGEDCAERLSGSMRKGRHITIEPDEDEECAEAIIYTPHDVNSEDLRVIPRASPPISTLAFLHGLHNVRLTSWGKTALQLNLGVYNGLKAQRVLNSKYWIGTHDEIKTGRGLVGWFIQRDVMSVHDALEQEKAQRVKGRHSVVDSEHEEVLLSFEDTRWLDLRNGESKVLV